MVNKIFRAFHTIKGMAGFLNLAEIQSLAHSAESLLDLARKGQLILAGVNSDVAFESIDALKKMLGGLKSALESASPVAPFEPLSRLLEKLKAAAEGRAAAVPLPEVKPPEPEGKQDSKLDVVIEETLDARKPKTSTALGAHAAEDKVKVSITRLDSLINLADRKSVV